MFVARQLQEKYREQYQDLYIAFVDLTKALNTANRDLWNIPQKFGRPPTYIDIPQRFHTGMCAQVFMAGSQSSSIPVDVGVKQCRVLAPIIFNLFLVAIALVCHRDLNLSDSDGVEYRHDGGLFDCQRLQTKTKNSSALISSLQYANNVAFPSLTSDGLRHSPDVISEAHLHADLIVNAMKTQILSASSFDAHLLH